MGTSEIKRLLKIGEGNDQDKGIGVVPSPIGYSEDQIGGASLDLRLGRWFLALHQSKRPTIDLSRNDTRSLDSRHGRSYYVPFNDVFVVHPGRFVLASTLEWVRLPLNLGAYITGKSQLGRRGLIIETAAGIHPGFSGCLALEITNCGEVPIAITPGMRIAQIFFHKVSGKAAPPASKFSGHRKPLFGRYALDFKTSEEATLFQEE